MLDTPTLLVTDVLLNATCGLMTFVWFRLRREPQFAYWASGFVVCALASVVAALATIIPVFAVVQFFYVGLGVGLYWAGYRVFDGKPAFSRRVACLTMMPSLVTASLWLGASNPLLPPVAGLAAFIVVLGSFACYILKGNSAERSTERMVGGWAMASFVLALSVSIALQFHSPDAQMGGYVVLVTDHVVTATFVVSLFAMSMDRAYRRIEDMALHDPLTGLLNRAGLAARMSQVHNGGGLLVADLDHFKIVNDRFGHPAGDTVLREFARRAQDLLGDEVILARMGGEEFVAILPDADKADMTMVAQRLRKIIRHRPVLSNDHEIYVTVSIGVADLDAREPFEDAIARADAALYRAKDGGRDCVAA